ncbi:AMP-binding protein [Clostridium perfringens]|uniref:AMP-binding protein n=1 Tax=Clostridium perfringens TaxID=1502 RepID=UPI001F29008A|nr:AMP-binding protein [Clostridium perfringens]ELC8332936.1 AMP-binding protein [Clostridium perfringens]ELC8423015.1 AMP-binding protein [Clostridium perfringens]ELC8451450.1 AMP-binding protein [Clostridium perfringens]MCF2687170.1 AMP-binding protein [Clostridium perfringens]MCI5748167.1 AMP-binding protein [Clostridium perfringens]
MKLFEEYLKILNAKQNEIAAVYGDKNKFHNYTYQEIRKMCLSIIDQIGIAKNNERLAIIIDNDINYLSAFLAGIFSGYTIVGINPHTTKEEISLIINENKVEYVLTVSRMSGMFPDKEILIDKLTTIDGQLSSVERLGESPCIISYTSGTSGSRSKGVILTNNNIYYVSEQYKKLYKVNRYDNIITFLPCWHNYGMIACLCNALFSCCKISILDKWDINLFKKLINKYKPTIFPGSPYMYIDIIHNKELLKNVDLKCLRICDSGGDSLPIGCIKEFEKISGATITEGYGLTETSSLTHFNISAAERKVGSIGKIVYGNKCQIRDIHGNILSPNEWGELWIKGNMVFAGYIEEDLNKEVFDLEGWFNTKDVVKVDEQGYYYIAGRLSDLHVINSNVDISRKIENCLYKSEMVDKVYIKVNFNKQMNFNSYELFVQGNEKMDVSTLYDYLHEEISDIIIDKVNIVERLELTDTGKIKRNKVGD